MILSAAELEIAEESAGILVLDEGRPARCEVCRAEPVLELEVTPNRVDCLGVYGSRARCTRSRAPLGAEPWAEDAPAEGKGEASDYASVAVEVPDLCPRFTARVFTDVEVGPSPAWLQARLTAAGQRPIANVVDITNYVMLLTAQPLHAFDLDKVPGGALTVRAAAEGEKMTTLDGVERVLDAETVLVCDRDGPSGIAGIMGGQVSEVSAETTRVLLEVANWNGTNILRTSRLLGLRSEASSRFEKQLHPELCMRAQRIASRLMVELCGAKLVPGTIDVAAEIPAPPQIRLRGEPGRGPARDGDRAGRPGRLPGAARLRGRGRRARISLVEVPPDRHYDVTREVDLIEEVARVHGLDEHLPSTLPGSAGQAGGLSRDQRLRRRAEDALRDLGFDEIVGWSFTDPGEADRLRIGADDPRAAGVAISNPLSEEQSAMRTTLLGSLLSAAQRNLARDAERVALFESGRVYLPGGEPGDGPLAGGFAGEQAAPFAEPHRLGCLAVGLARAEVVAGRGRGRRLLRPQGRAGGPSRAARDVALLRAGDRAVPASRPGRAGSASAARRPAGSASCTRWSAASGIWRQRSASKSIWRRCSPPRPPARRPSRTSPPSRRCVRTSPSSSRPRSPRRRCAAAVLAGGGELLRAAEVFDLYEGEQVGEGRKSLALRLEFRAADRTLTDEEVAAQRDSIAAKLGEIGGSIRE